MPKFPTRKQFKEWLARQPDTTEFIKCHPTLCPLVVFLKTVDTKNWVVGIESYGYDEVTYPLPLWAINFVKKFDALPGHRVRSITDARRLVR